MRLRRLVPLPLPLAVAVPVTLLLVLGMASPAAAIVIERKLTVMLGWTQPSTASYSEWNSARVSQDGWTEYAFDWSTDYCSKSPEQPLGFDFRLSCWRHDFGYRNYKKVGQLPAHKSRVDDAFYFDLKAKCGEYNRFVRPACLSLAWSYYQAVRMFARAVVSKADLDRAAALKADGLRAQARAEAMAAPAST